MPIITKGAEMLRRSSFEDRLLAGLVSTRSTNRKGRLHASSSGFCPRRNVFHATEKREATMNASGELYATIGNAVHEALSKALDHAGMLWAEEYHILPIKLEDGVLLNLGGYIDSIANDGRPWVIEWKTCGNLPSSPRPAHKRQAEIYSAVTGFPFRIVYQSRTVTTYGRGRPLIRTFEFEYSKAASRNAFFILAQSTRFINLGVVPPRPLSMNKTLCSKTYCPFASICWGDDSFSAPAASTASVADVIRQAEADAEFLVEKTAERQRELLEDLLSVGTRRAKFEVPSLL